MSSGSTRRGMSPRALASRTSCAMPSVLAPPPGFSTFTVTPVPSSSCAHTMLAISNAALDDP